MPPLVALKPHRYDGRLVRKGERYTAQSDSDATLLTAIGYSRHDAPAFEPKSGSSVPPPAPEPEPAPEPAPEPEPPTAAEPVVAEEPEQTPDVPTDPANPPKRRYRRKDMAAEG